MRAVYATAAFSGLRRGELRGLKWSDVDFEARRISVVRSWDDYEGEITPKSKAATRLASMPRVLASSLAEHKLAREKAAQPDHFVFSSNGGETVFTPPNVRERALVAWKNANLERPITKQLNPIGLHECRHSFVSLAFAAGVRRETVQGWVGHSSQSVTDIYRHTRPEVFDAELALLDDYLSKTKLATPPLVLSSTNGVGG